jgi:hypothetical protein
MISMRKKKIPTNKIKRKKKIGGRPLIPSHTGRRRQSLHLTILLPPPTPTRGGEGAASNFFFFFFFLFLEVNLYVHMNYFEDRRIHYEIWLKGLELIEFFLKCVGIKKNNE